MKRAVIFSPRSFFRPRRGAGYAGQVGSWGLGLWPPAGLACRLGTNTGLAAIATLCESDAGSTEQVAAAPFSAGTDNHTFASVAWAESRCTSAAAGCRFFDPNSSCRSCSASAAVPTETVPFFDTSGILFPSAMAGSPAVSAVSGSNASLFGATPAVSAGLLSSRRLTSGPDYQMIGDQAPLTLRQAASTAPGLPPPFPPGAPPAPPGARLASAIVPSVRGFKIAENQSPQPQDRVFFTFDYFSDLNGALNRRFESPVNGLTAYRYIFGFEKTFDEGFGSVGFRLPLDSLSANSAISGNFVKPGGTSTALNDLSLFTKYVLKVDPATGSLLSVGLEATLPTGPSQFAGAKYYPGHSQHGDPAFRRLPTDPQPLLPARVSLAVGPLVNSRCDHDL